MLRAFQTHRIRKTRELSASLWEFSPAGGSAGRKLSVPVPGCWETFPETRRYRGKACYEKTFEAGGNIRLVFKGVSHTARVSVDGAPAAAHYNAYTPFDAVLTDLPEGSHRLRVEVDNSYGPHSTLHIPNDYQTYGGITRGVSLELLREAYVSRIHFTPFPAEPDETGAARPAAGWMADLLVTVRSLSGTGFDGSLSLSLGDRQIASAPVHVPAGQTADLRFEGLSFPDVRSWSPDHPALYECSAVLFDEAGAPVDDLIERVGFRQVRIRGREILLNGESLRIKGFCRHEDHPAFGCSIPFQAMCDDLALMREAGANAVRTVHYPNDELFLDLCDELGMLVWEESHARALTEEQMKNPLFMEQSTACVREMIDAHYNHPCIIIWGFLNECASDTAWGKTCYQKHADLIRSLDKSRPVSFSSCRNGTDLCLGIPDIVSFNIYPEWYEDVSAKEYLNGLTGWIERDTEGAGKPFLITETGAGAVYGFRSLSQVKWSEEYQAKALENQLRAVFDTPGCIGVFIWQLCDVQVSDEWFAARPRTMNNKGVVDEFRRPKLAFETVRKMFRFL